MGGGVLLMIMDGVYQIVSTKNGQNTLGLADRLLCIAEALNFFSMPRDQQMEVLKESKGVLEYKRPLPWILYIPMLFYCRLVRWVIAVLGAPFQFKMDATIAVAYLQSWRRKLRYYKIQGLRIMKDPKPMVTSLPWFLVWAIQLFVWGPLQLLTFFDMIVFRNKSFGFYTTSAQPRSKRLLKKLKATDNGECSTSDLLDKFAEDDDNDTANDPDFEVKSTDLLSDTDEEDEMDEVEENSEPEEDTKLRENGGHQQEHEGGADQQHHQENNQNPEGDHEHHIQENHGQSEEHHHQEHHHHHH